ncbi:MAG TPA: PA14 domain-containing protein [Planctomycetota bacterium]|nr:PA14 domain-containing protein [Planctomycetota bacterium]
MGQEILYCYKCQTRLLGSEFEKGKAFKVGGQASCATCVKDLLASMPEAQAEVDRKLSSSSRMRVPAGDASPKVKPPTVRSAPGPAPVEEKSKAPLIIAVVGGSILLLALAAAMSGGRQRINPSPSESTGPIHPPAPPPPTPPRPEEPKPPTPGSPFAAELREIDEKMRVGLGNEEFRQVAELLDGARKRRATPEWLSEIDLRLPQVEARVRRAAQPLRDGAVEAQKAKKAADVKRLRDKVVAWGFPSVVEEFDRALSDAAADVKPPPPPPLPAAAGPPKVIYDDAMAPNVLNWSWNCDIDLGATAQAFEGTKSIAVTPKIKDGALYLQINDGVDSSQYKYFTFAVYVTEPGISCGLQLYGDQKGWAHPPAEFGGLPNPGEWKRFVIPVASLNAKATKITGFVFQVHRTATTPLLYIDSVAFLNVADAAPPPPPAAGAHLVYGDALAPGCRNSSWSSTVDFASTAQAFEGSRSISLATHQMAAGLYIALDRSVDPAEFPYVTFALYIADDNTKMGVALYNDWKPSGAVGLDHLGGWPKNREWKRFVVPVTSINPNAKKITGFILQVYKTADHPLVYVDSIAFLKTAESTTPKPAAKPPAAELEAYRARWTQAAAKAALREYAGAQRELEEASAAMKDDAAKAEAAADLELLKLAAQVPLEAVRILDKWPKGQKVKLDFLNAAGERESVEGTLISADALRVSVLRETPLDIPVCELLPSTLAELFRGRADKKPTDARAAAAFCVFDGDLETARKLWGDGPAMPEKMAGHARPRTEAELAARRTFWAAEADFASPKRRAAAVEKYASLPAADARLRPYVAARLEAAKDTVFLADDLNGAGAFVTAANAKLDACWTSTADGPATKAKENYVEAEFYAFPGVPYRAWVWAGACCLETFEFWIQATELVAPGSKPLACEPGGDNAVTAKAPSLSLKKWHAGHGGAKEPSKWDWFPVTLPKYETAGAKKLRILSAQQGFTVGAIVVSAVRKETPREADIKELEKLRFGARKNSGGGPMGYILHEYWLNIEGSTVEDLTKSPAFAGKPSGSSLREIFEAPVNFGERFGARMRGYVHPPMSGAYTFWIASDDFSELWLSSDDTAAKKKLVAKCEWAAGPRDWTRGPTCKSAPIPLVAGRRYYIEALHKEGGGDDHCAVGWTLPDNTEERPIPGSRLSPFGVAAPPSGPPGTVFYRGYNIGGPPTIIDGRKWEGKGSPNLATTGEGLDFPNVPLIPPTDDARAAMIRDFAWQKDSSVVKIYSMAPGAYQIYLYVWENDNPQTYDIYVQDKLVLKGHNSGQPGHWDKLGPWPVAVGDNGVLHLYTAGGDANLSGLEIWKVGK